MRKTALTVVAQDREGAFCVLEDVKVVPQILKVVAALDREAESCQDLISFGACVDGSVKDEVIEPCNDCLWKLELLSVTLYIGC